MFAARHLRYEIYEKKQIQPLLGHRRPSRSNRSESEHSLTASADPRSPDVAVGVGSETVGDAVLGCAPSDEAAAYSDAAVCPVPDQTVLPTLDIRLRRMSTSTLASLAGTASLDDTDYRSPAVDACKDSCWPTRSFPLADADYDKLIATESCDNSTCQPSAYVSVDLKLSVDSGVPLAGPVMTDNTDWTSDTPQSDVHSTPSVTPATTLC